jgi:threonylcarbamoyladenosine tRNA methylthiotransferase MtaB
MARRYCAGAYLDLLATIRAAIPGVAITTDVIVGFPGEDEAAFTESYRTCEAANFAGMHVFRYSLRQGTAAARFGDPVPPAEKKRRAAALLELATRQQRAFYEQQVGQTVTVLWEEQTGAVWTGLTDHYVRAFLPVDGVDRRNRLERVQVTRAEADGVWVVPASAVE